MAAAAAATVSQMDRPGLAFFYSEVSGPCRRIEGFLAKVLQRRGNHRTFRIYCVPVEKWPDLHECLGIKRLPTLAVIERKRMIERLVQPRSCPEIERFLAPWMTD